MLIGLVGWIGSGKGTAGDILSDIGFRKESFAGSLKDAVSVVFGWDRELLEGDTEESRQFREIEDKWWSEKLGKPITPRWILQHWGTELIRNNFHDHIWVLSLQRRLQNTNDHIVLTDVRFFNEVEFIKNLGGVVVHIKRGNDPSWVSSLNGGVPDFDNGIPGVHRSEWEWVNNPNIAYTLENEGSKEDLKNNIIKLLTSIEGDSILTELFV